MSNYPYEKRLIKFSLLLYKIILQPIGTCKAIASGFDTMLFDIIMIYIYTNCQLSMIICGVVYGVMLLSERESIEITGLAVQRFLE